MNKVFITPIQTLACLVLYSTVVHGDFQVTINSPTDQTIVPENTEQDIDCTVSGGSSSDCYTYTWTDTSGDDLTNSDTYNGQSTSSTSDTLQYNPGNADLDVAEDVEVDATDSEGDEDFDDVEIDVPAIKDSSPGTNIYDAQPNINQPLIVGEMMNLTVDVPNQGVSSPNWTVGGLVDASWDSSSNSSTVNTLTDTTDSSVSYFYADGTEDGPPVQTSCAFTADDGSTQNVNCEFYVDIPNDPGLSVTSPNPVGIFTYGTGIGSSQMLEFGPGYVNPNTGNQGIVEQWTNPPSCPDGYSGSWAVVQTVDTANNVGTSGAFLGNYNLDVESPEADAAPPTNVGGTWGDAPGYEIEHTVGVRGGHGSRNIYEWDSFSSNETFTTWLMFKPSVGTNSQWVPMESWDWCWEGTATLNGVPTPGYTLSGDSSSIPSGGDISFGNAVGNYPTYSGNIHNSQYVNSLIQLF